jgi:hypothetical protein
VATSRAFRGRSAGVPRAFRGEINMRKIPIPWTTVFSNDTAGTFQPATGWYDTSIIAQIRGEFELRARMNQLDVTLAYQTANVETSPDAAVPFGAARSSDGIEFPTGYAPTTTKTDGKRQKRFGFFVKNTTGTAISMGRVAAVLELIEP